MPEAQQILVRTPEAASFLKTSFSEKAVSTSKGSEVPSGVSSLIWSKDADFYALLTGGNVIICSSQTDKQEGQLGIPGLHALDFSPQSNYIITFQKPSKDSGNADKNLKLWDWRTGSIKLQLFQKSFSRDSWPSLQLTFNEDLAFHQVTNCVNAYTVQDAAAGVAKKLNLKGVAAFGLSPDASSPVLAAFVPEGKGQPGFVGLWKALDLDKGPNSAPAFARRSFFRATSARLLWNAKGSALLALTASETDASNKSYYGEQKLHYLAANGSTDCLVPLPKEGPVHDVQWSPSGDHFVSVSGYMPSKTNLFNAKCKMLHELCTGPYNLVRWNPQGRFIAVAGFGNLPGDIGFHEKHENDSCAPLGAARAEDGVAMDWSPDGRCLMTATTAPRMRVNNGIQMFRYTGDTLHEQKFPVLSEARWRPVPSGTFEDRPSSPRKSGAVSAAASAAPIRAAGYIPPQFRSAGGASTSGGHFSMSSEQKPSSRLGGARSRTVVPGAEPPPAAPAKSGRKRSKGKGKGDADESSSAPRTNGTAVTANGHSAVQEGVAKLGIQEDDSSQAADPSKRIRNLKKKLTQIQQLREKQEAGAPLEAEQQAKIGSEAGILEELRSLEAA